jgi:hypothetical protein
VLGVRSGLTHLRDFVPVMMSYARTVMVCGEEGEVGGLDVMWIQGMCYYVLRVRTGLTQLQDFVPIVLSYTRGGKGRGAMKNL